MLGAVNEGSVLRMTDHPKSAVSEDQNYYETQPEIEEIQSDFQVQAYDMELTFGHELSAKVTASIMSENTPKQCYFTLYHGYKISKIESTEGETLFIHSIRIRWWQQNNLPHQNFRKNGNSL